MGRGRLKISLDLGESEKDPARFRDCAKLADKLGFDAAWLGDHFLPWIHSADRSAFVWSLIGCCLEATKKIKLGPLVSTPIGGRYHPAMVAQASATLDNMYPGRLLIAVGTGEAMNEVPFLGKWPPWAERIDRLIEGVTLIRRFWNSPSYFDFEGTYFKMKQVYLYTKPKTDLQICFSGDGPKSARIAGQYGDHLITESSMNPLERCKGIIFPAFDGGASIARKNPDAMEKIVALNFTLADERIFLKKTRKAAAVVTSAGLGEPDPRKIEQMGTQVSDDDLLKRIYFCSTWTDVIDLISKFQEIGATQVILPSGPDLRLIRDYAKRILSHFKRK